MKGRAGSQKVAEVLARELRIRKAQKVWQREMCWQAV